MWNILATVLGPLIGFGLNHLLGESRWAKIRKAAKVIVKDPSRTSDPRQAVEEALVKFQSERVAKEAAKVKLTKNGTNPFKKISSDDLHD